MKHPAIQVKLTQVKTEEITFKEPDEEFITSFDERYLQVGIGVKFSPYKENSTLTIHLHFFYEYIRDAEPTIKLLSYQGAFTYIIDDFNENVTIHDHAVHVTDHILTTLLGISISTARGIIIAKTAGSFINKYYLPIFDPQEILKGIKSDES